MARTDEKESRRPYVPIDFVMVRAPLLPIQSYLAWRDASSGNAVESLWLAATDPRVRCALAVGSPSLFEGLERTKTNEKNPAKVLAKLRRFLVRMSTRPTPYGMFAGVAVAKWGAATDICLSGAICTRTRVDMDWLLRFVLALESQPTIRNQLRWVANTAAWHQHSRLMLSQRLPPLPGRSPAPISVAAKPVVRCALELARHPVPYAVLTDRLATEFPTAGPKKIERALEQLWEHGFLLTELLPPLTIEDPIRWVRDRLAPIMGGKTLCVQLDALLRSIAACDAEPIERVPDLLRKAAAHVRSLGQTQTEMPLQVDMAFPVSAERLSSAIADEAVRTAELLFRLTTMPNGPPNVVAYRQAFVTRYGIGREVPLLELLNPEWGLGPIGQFGWGGLGLDWGIANSRAEVLQQLALDAIRHREHAVELDEELLGRLKGHALAGDRLPASIDLNLFVLASSAEAIDAGEFQIMLGPNLGAPMAGRNLGRFAHLLGQKVCAALESLAHSDEELHPQRMTAEIVGLPRDFRFANVVVRPPVRRYEVNHGVSAGVSPECVIPFNELVVGVRRDRFYVRWVPRDVEILFTSGHMLNPNQSSPECEFLCDVGRDGVAQPNAFSWGPAAGYPFLPRVQSGRIILHCAQWRLEPAIHGQIPLKQSNKFATWFAHWRERWGLPRHVYLSWADHRLLYDLEDPEQVDDLRRELVRNKEHTSCLLQEALPGPEHAWLPSMDGGRRIVELVVSLKLQTAAVKADPDPLTGTRQPTLLISSNIRLRPPGSNWLFVKLYGPRSGENDLLTGPIRRLWEEIQQAQTADAWFFLRYADPDPHLRLRFQGTPERLTRSC